MAATSEAEGQALAHAEAVGATPNALLVEDEIENMYEVSRLGYRGLFSAT